MEYELSGGYATSAEETNEPASTECERDQENDAEEVKDRVSTQGGRG